MCPQLFFQVIIEVLLGVGLSAHKWSTPPVMVSHPEMVSPPAMFSHAEMVSPTEIISPAATVSPAEIITPQRRSAICACVRA